MVTVQFIFGIAGHSIFTFKDNFYVIVFKSFISYGKHPIFIFNAEGCWLVPHTYLMSDMVMRGRTDSVCVAAMELPIPSSA